MHKHWLRRQRQRRDNRPTILFLEIELKEFDKRCIFEKFNIILRKFTVIQVMICTYQQSFFKLTLVKFKLRSTMLQYRLHNLMLSNIDQEIAINLNLTDISKTLHNTE